MLISLYLLNLKKSELENVYSQNQLSNQLYKNQFIFIE